MESKQSIFEYRQVSYLSKRGHKFKVVSIKWNGQALHEKVNDNIDVARIPYIYLHKKIMYPIPNLYKLSKEINDIIISWKPDFIIFSHMEYLISLPVLFLKRKCPIIVTTDCLPGISWFYNDPVVDTVGRSYSILLGKAIFKKADGIQLLSSQVYPHLCNLIKAEIKTFIIPRGTDIDIFKPSEKDSRLLEMLGIGSNDTVILFVGRLDPVKGIENLLNAFKIVLDEYPNLKLLLVGDGELRGNGKKYKKLAESISESIIFTGYRDDVPLLMNISDIFVLPSFSEGAANVVLEASSSGLPVIASRVGEIPNIISDYKSGILIHPGNVKDLVGALKYLLENPIEAKEMGLRGRQIIIKNYTWDAICRKIELMCDEIAKNFKK